jgi:AcrR family transcriptional regulator
MTRSLSCRLHESLLASAEELFYADGIASTSVERVCRLAGVGKPVLYRHFGSKQALVLEYLQRRHALRKVEVGQALAEAGTDAEARVFAVIDWVGQWIATDDYRGCSFLRAMSESSTSRDVIQEATRSHKHWLRDLLVHEAKPLALDAERVASHLFLLIEGAVSAAIYGDPPRVAADLRAAAADVLRHAVHV